MIRAALRAGAVALVLAPSLSVRAAEEDARANAEEGEFRTSESRSALPDFAIPMKPLPKRVKPILELGGSFLGAGPINGGFTLPTGAVWQPQLLAWGSARTALSGIGQSGTTTSSDWANRVDLFGQLFLTATERVVVSFRPTDEGDDFTGHVFSSPIAGREGGVDAFNASVRTVYFEGDFGELFPNLDKDDKHGLDLGFGVGRMPVVYQDGMLVGDAINAVGVVRNTLRPFGVSNLRLTGVFGWGNVNRGGSTRVDSEADLYGLFAEMDIGNAQFAIDAAYVTSPGLGGDGFFAGVSAIGRIAKRFNTVVRVLTSQPSEGETPEVGRGVMAFGTVSFTPRRTHDIAYLTAFAAFDRYTPAARAAGTGGPLGRVGILFEGAGLGAYAPVLSNQAIETFGGAIGYQRFFHHNRGQVTFETALRRETAGTETLAWAFGSRLQHALGRRFILRLDGFVVAREDENLRVGGRSELLLKF